MKLLDPGFFLSVGGLDLTLEVAQALADSSEWE
jgi:hypothetical protein